jgi:hypothetical protein
VRSMVGILGLGVGLRAGPAEIMSGVVYWRVQ